MEKSNVCSWLVHKRHEIVRNLLCVLNATLWLFVFYFSVHEDKIAAVFSYFAVVLTVILVKCGYKVIQINQSFAYLTDVLSKTLILAGIFLVLSQFWNTAFYSICLGIIIQKMRYEIESTSFIVSSSLNVKDIHEDGETGTPDGERKLQFHNADKIKIKDNLRNPNNDEKFTNISRISQMVKKLRNTVYRICSSGTINKFPDICRIPNSCKEKFVLYIQKFKNFSVGCYEKVSIVDADNIKNVKENGVKIESTLEQGKEELEPKTCLTNDDIENKIVEVASLFALKTQILSIQEQELQELNEYLEALSDCKSDETKEMNIDTNENPIALNDEILKLLYDDINQVDSIENVTESQSEPGSRLNGYSRIKANVCSSIGLDNENSSPSIDNYYCWHHYSGIKDEFNLEHVNIFQDSVNFLNSDISGLDKVLQHKQNGARVSTDVAINQEKSSVIKNDLQSDILVETNENLYSKNKNETSKCMTENINVQPKEKCEYRMKSMSDLKHVENLKTVSEKHGSELFLKLEDSKSETLSNSCNVFKSSLIDNESADNAEDTNDTKEFVKVKSEEVGLKNLSEDTHDEGVVNRIDLSFIYALGFNVNT